VRVAEVDPGAGDLDQHLPVGRFGVGQLDQLHQLGPAEFLYLDGSHSPEVCQDGAPCR
jgi:hypothetical protein